MSGFKTLYHIGKRKPIPRPNPSGGWIRPHPKKPITGPVVFFTPNWERVWRSHGVEGNVYIYKVPHKVIKRCGMRNFDYATEIIIPEKYWGECKLIGKIDRKKAEKKIKLNQSYRRENVSPPGSCLEGGPSEGIIRQMMLDRREAYQRKNHV